jgi:hypothetical protein
MEMGDKKVKSALLAFSVLLILSSGCGITVTRNYYFAESGLEVKKLATKETTVKVQSLNSDTKRK